MPLAVPSGDKRLLTGPYGPFPMQFVRFVTSHFPDAAERPYGSGAAASAKDPAPKPNILIPPAMRSLEDLHGFSRSDFASHF